MVRDSCSSMATMTALAMVYGWIEGVKNLWNQLDGRLMRENMRVKVCPAMTTDVRIFGQLYLECH